MRNEILELSVEFSLQIIAFCEELESKRKFVIAKQLLRSGTAVEHLFTKHKVLKVAQTLFIN